MSERMTSIHLPGNETGTGLSDYGHKSHAEMVKLYRQEARYAFEWSSKVLMASDEDFVVETYLGSIAPRKRERVYPRMTGSVLVHPEGSVRSINYSRIVDGKYLNTSWPSIEGQVKEATLQNLQAHTSYGHVDEQLYMMAEDCPHEDPDQAEKYEGVYDLINEWCARNIPMLKWPDRDLYWKNRARAQSVIPLAAQYNRESSDYNEMHNNVCLESPMGMYCSHEDCSEGDPDEGIEPASCRRFDVAQEQRDMFWYKFSTEGAEDRAAGRFY